LQFADAGAEMGYFWNSVWRENDPLPGPREVREVLTKVDSGFVNKNRKGREQVPAF
jgi:hypothetical protein